MQSGEKRKEKRAVSRGKRVCVEALSRFYRRASENAEDLINQIYSDCLVVTNGYEFSN